MPTLQKLFAFTGALSFLIHGFAWWRKGSAEEDATVAEAADTVLDALSDGDLVQRIDCLTDRNLREQLTVEQAIELDKERTLRRFGRRN
jgi:hypothetical protein